MGERRCLLRSLGSSGLRFFAQALLPCMRCCCRRWDRDNASSHQPAAWLLPPTAAHLCVEAGASCSSSFVSLLSSLLLRQGARALQRSRGRQAARCTCSLGLVSAAAHARLHRGWDARCAPLPSPSQPDDLRRRRPLLPPRGRPIATARRARRLQPRRRRRPPPALAEKHDRAAGRVAAAARLSPARGRGTLRRARRMMTRLFRHRYCLPEAVPPGAGAQRGPCGCAARPAPLAGGRPTWGECTHKRPPETVGVRV